MPAFFLVWLFKIIKTEKINLYLIRSFFNIISIKSFLIALVSYIILILPTFIMFILPQARRGGSSFTGISPNFYFDISSINGMYEKINYIATFFIQNGFKTIRFITTYLPMDNVYFNVSALIIIVFFIFGLIRLNFSSNNIYKYIGRFLVVSILTIIVLIIMKKIALAPSRHSLIYLPYVAFSIAYSVGEIYNFIQKRIKLNVELISILILIILIVAPFFSHYKDVLVKRNDPFDEKIINSIIEQYKPRYVVAPDLNLWARDVFRDWKKYVSDDQIYLYSASGGYNAGIYMLTSQFDAGVDDVCGKKFEEFGYLAFICDKNLYKILYEYNIDNNSTLDITSETKQVYNRLSIKIIKKL